MPYQSLEAQRSDRNRSPHKTLLNDHTFAGEVNSVEAYLRSTPFPTILTLLVASASCYMGFDLEHVPSTLLLHSAIYLVQFKNYLTFIHRKLV